MEIKIGKGIKIENQDARNALRLLIADSEAAQQSQYAAGHLTFFLSQGEWRPTAVPQQAFFQSYWIPSYYSPVKDIETYRSFRNTKKGLPWEENDGEVNEGITGK